MFTITNWFAFAAGICFLGAFLSGIESGQEPKIIIFYGLLAAVNTITGTL